MTAVRHLKKRWERDGSRHLGVADVGSIAFFRVARGIACRDGRMPAAAKPPASLSVHAEGRHGKGTRGHKTETGTGRDGVWFIRVRGEDLWLCRCGSPALGLCTHSSYTAEGCALLEANSRYLGQYVCLYCGGVAGNVPDIMYQMTGETIIRRLLDIGFASKPVGWNTGECHRFPKWNMRA